MAAGAQLSIDYWHTTVAAALRTADGRIVPIAVDGAAISTTGVAVSGAELRPARAGVAVAAREPQSYVRMPAEHLLDAQVVVAGVEVDPVDLMAATLSTVVGEARLIAGEPWQEVTIGVPAKWSRRQRDALLTAAGRAGIDDATIVSGAASILREETTRGATVPDGSYALVVRLDATVGEVTVLHAEDETFAPVVELDVGELGETPGETLGAQAAAALADALRDGDLRVDHISTVFVQIPDATVPELRAALASVGVTGSVVQVTELAAALGGARPSRPFPGPATAAPAAGVAARAVLALGVTWGAAGVLTYQAFTSSTAYPDLYGHGTWLVTALFAWGMISVFITLGAVALALFVAYARRTAPIGPDPTLGAALVVAATFGIGSAATLALITAQHFGASPGPLLRWTLLSTAPLAAALAGLGFVVAREDPPQRSAQTPPQPWRDRVRFPVAAQALAALSTVSIVAALTGVPAIDAGAWWRLAHLGGYLMGWAIAFLIPVNPWRRVTVGFLLSTAATYAIGLQTAGFATSCLVAAITLWWVLRLTPALSRRLDPRWGRITAQSSS